MELYIVSHIEIGDCFRSDEEYGDWYSNESFYIDSVHIKKPKITYAQITPTTVNFDVGDTAYILIMTYSSGDSFGSSGGNAEILWVFKDEMSANQAYTLWHEADSDNPVVFLDDFGTKVTLSNPASGYFENVSSIEVQKFIIKA